MRDATLCFLVKGNPPREILLGMKKTGFGQGKHNGFGGKVEPGETIPAATVREFYEETSVRLAENDLRPAAVLTFLFPHRPEWDQTVYAFVAWTWEGEPAESREMLPAWVKVDDIPYERMWHDDSFWLPRVLRGEQVRATFVYAADNETVERATFEDWGEDQA